MTINVSEEMISVLLQTVKFAHEKRAWIGAGSWEYEVTLDDALEMLENLKER